MMKIDFRRALSEDALEISKMEADIFQDAWTKADVFSTITSNGAMSYIAEYEGRILAYVLARRVLNEGEIYRVATRENYRGQKVAEGLLSFLFENEEELSDLYLEVRESNLAARHLYEKCGFVETSIRKNYYKSPVENGVNMHKKLTTKKDV
jgi:ribosomal-protein-alanine N-acetyltransferase